MGEIRFEIDTNVVILLLVIFVLLKLFKVVTWSWWWIFCPLWLPIVISVVLIVINKLIAFFRNE